MISVSNFRKWMNENRDEDYNLTLKKPKSNLIGLEVESKLDRSKLVEKLSMKEGTDSDLIAEDFCENNGKIIEVIDKTFLIEVDSGVFSIKRCHVRKA